MNQSEVIAILSHEIYALLDMHGLDGEESLKVLAAVATRLLCYDAPDRRTAEQWRDALSGVIYLSMSEAGSIGSARWSEARMH